MDNNTETITVNVQGNIVLAEFPEQDNLCVRIHITAQNEWQITSGQSSQTSSFSFRGVNNNIFIDLPFEFSMQGVSPFMWPRIVVNCYSKNTSGNERTVGYGSTSVPSEPGKHVERLYCFLPVTSSTAQWIIGKLRGTNEEFTNPLFPATSDGRYACQTSSEGFIDLELNVSVKTGNNGLCLSKNTTDTKSSFAAPSIFDVQKSRHSPN